MLISLDALQILDAIDTRGSFAAAADALHRVPSALTHAIRKLEDDLAVTLFVFAVVLWLLSGLLVRWMHGAETLKHA